MFSRAQRALDDLAVPAEALHDRLHAAPRVPASCVSASPPSSVTRSSRARTTRARTRTARARNACALELVGRARAAGPAVAACPGGVGRDRSRPRGKAVVFEEAGYSPLGAARAEHLRARRGQHAPAGQVGDARQKEHWLRPLRAGRDPLVLRHDRAGRRRRPDPSMLLTTARATDGDGFVIDGRKWLITGADGAAFAIVMARTFDARERPARRCSSRRRARHPHRAGARHDGPVLRRRPLRWSVRRTARAGERVLGEVGQGFATPRCGWRRPG